MSFNEVKELRESGRLQEALDLALDELKSDKDNIWNKRSLAWVYYDFLKKTVDIGDSNEFLETIEKIKSIELPTDENMIYDSMAWQIGKFIFLLVRENRLETTFKDNLFNHIKDMGFTKPSESYSFLHKAFLKTAENWDKYCEFADWWGLENFHISDYKAEEYKGNVLMSTVELAYINYSKSLLKGELILNEGPIDFSQRKINKDRIRNFLIELDKLIDEHPEYVYPPYYKAKLLLEIGDKENALETFIPFAKIKKNDFWVWELLAEIFIDEPEVALSCYCKALSSRIKGSFLVKTREKFANFLFEHGYNNEARTEIDQLIVDRQNEGWRIPNSIISLKNSTNYQNAIPKKSNKEFYNQYKSKAEEILYLNELEETILVTHVNEQKKFISYAIDKDKTGFFKNNSQKKILVGDVYKVRFASVDDENGYSKINTLNKSENPEHFMLRIDEGSVKINEGSNYGHVNNSFIPPPFINTNGLNNGDEGKFLSILNYDKNRDRWNWKVVRKIKD